MEKLTKKDYFNIIMWAGIMSSYLLTINTFIAISKFGQVTYREPNNLVLWGELIMAFVFGVMLFITIFNYFNYKLKRKEESS